MIHVSLDLTGLGLFNIAAKFLSKLNLSEHGEYNNVNTTDMFYFYSLPGDFLFLCACRAEHQSKTIQAWTHPGAWIETDLPEHGA